ncbi:MAG: glycosyltransferase family 2 protein [Firmicutes bacterium]|nr:glycosyltransferase family 2 protein [Bacillota bacterium]
MFKSRLEKPSKESQHVVAEDNDTEFLDTRVAAIVPAYNEGHTISQVLAVLQGVPDIDEIIVVNDGSHDDTADKAAKMGVRVLNLYPNRGKGGAMKAGVQATLADIILFIDADLVGLNENHCRDLLEPVLQDRADMTIGLFSGGRTSTTLAQKMAPFLSGQRAMRRKIMECIPELEDSRYGVEVAISRYASSHSIRVEKVPLQDVSQIMKEEKQGFVTGTRNRIMMYWEILKVLKPK